MKNFRLKAYISSEYYTPIFFNENKDSFQWSKTKVIPLEKDDEAKVEKNIDDSFEFSYDLPANSIEEAKYKAGDLFNFIINIVSLHYSVGYRIKSPVSIIDTCSNEAVQYNFMQLNITKKEFCDKKVDFYFPFKSETENISSESILTYEPSEIFKVKDFHETIELFSKLYFYINKETKDKINFSMDMLRDAYQIPSFSGRFIGTDFWAC